MAEATADQKVGTLIFDGVEYAMDQLSEEARTQITNLRATDSEIARLRQHLAIFQTARSAYASALKQALPPAAQE
jgi:nicotinic acid phosphoribosyltransferase